MNTTAKTITVSDQDCRVLLGALNLLIKSADDAIAMSHQVVPLAGRIRAVLEAPAGPTPELPPPRE